MTKKREMIPKIADFRCNFEIIMKITIINKISAEMRLFSTPNSENRVSWPTDSFDFFTFQKKPEIYQFLPPNPKIRGNDRMRGKKGRFCAQIFLISALSELHSRPRVQYPKKIFIILNPGKKGGKSWTLISNVFCTWIWVD